MRWAVRLTKPVLMLVAFALSMFLYLYVQREGPTMKDRVSLTIQSKNLDTQKFVFDQEGAFVEFEVAGPRDKVEQLVANPQSAMAIVDLRKYRPASEQGVSPVDNFKPVVRPPQDFEGVTFTQIGTLDGKIEPRKTRDVKIKVEFESPPPGVVWTNYDRDSFETLPVSVTLTGAASIVDTVVPTVVINPKDAEQDGEVRARLSQVQSNLVMTPRVDWVTVRPSRSQRQVYVNVVFSGHAAPGYEVSNYFVKGEAGPSATPSTTWVRGPSGLVSKTSAIDAPVDISGLHGGWTYTVTPKLPPGLELMDPPLQIHVDIAKSRR
ncbi:MAG TPA: CdaR family protein [Fimbriimonadaceae bacterium]|nr:CdaR family protein [Fimbriimonadaceae bacterium]